jgi:site-specific DNA-methyltransferase (adenine-specific)
MKESITTNCIYNEDCLQTLSRMQDESVDLIITSPPYNKNHWLRNRSENNGGRRVIAYDSISDDMPHDQYVQQQKHVISECLRVLKPTGSLFYNHTDILHKHLTIHPTYVYDFPVKQVLIWDRTNTPKLGIEYFMPITEWFFWIKKSKDAKPLFKRNQMSFMKNIIRIPPDTKNNHPAPFPLSLANNFLLGCTDEGGVVYDPYMGSGTTAIASVMNNRKYIGSEISDTYCALARKRIAEHQAQQVFKF